MTGQLLADLLLEMDVLNIPELKREIRKLGAHVTDPLAQRWFLRAVTHWMVNIDKLMATPYKAVAEPRTIRGAPGYYEPFPREQVPLNQQIWHEAPPPPKPIEKPCPKCKGEGSIGGETCPRCRGSGTTAFPFRTGLECPVCRGSKVQTNPDTGQEETCTLCKGTGTNPEQDAGTLMVTPEEIGTQRRTGVGIYTCAECKGKGTGTGGEGCPVCHGSGRVRKEGDQAMLTDPNLLYVEVKRGSRPKSKRREGHFPESMALAHFLLDEAQPLNPLHPQDPEGVYTSMLHQPDIEKHIQQNFTPFKASQAKPLGKTQLGEPPPKERLPSYVTGEQEFYHFNPIQARRRELFQRLTKLVHYLNYKHSIRNKAMDKAAYAAALAGAKDLGDESVLAVQRKQEEAKKSVDFFKWLAGQSPENIDVFRQIMRDSEQFAHDITDKPWLFDEGSQVIAREGVYKIIKVISGPLAMKMSNRPLKPPYKGHSVPGWCTKDDRANGYIRQGPLYFIDKNDQNFVLVHFESSQAKMPDQGDVPPAVAKALVPVILKAPGFANQVREAGGDGEIGALAQALENA